MALWIVLTVMCSLAVMLVTVPLVRRYENYKDMASAGTSIFTDQLREIERDRGLGVIGEKEAELAKIEIERRLIAAARNVTAPKPISPTWRTVALVAAVGFVVLGSVNFYALRGSPDKTGRPPPSPVAATAQEPAQNAAGTPTASEVDAMIGKLAKRLEQNPNDADGWRMLGWSYFNTQRYEESAAAYGKAMAIDPANPDYKAGHAEALVQNAQGMVTPRAQDLFAEVLKADPKELRARFYMALAREQAGDFSSALDGWLSLLADAPSDAGWVPNVKNRVADLAKKTGRDVSAAMASAPAISQEEMAAVKALPAEDQQAMIKGMVERLAEKLAQSPHDSESWLRLIRSRMVLNQPDLAKEALKKALAEFAGDPAISNQIAASARQLGVVLE